MNPHSAIEATLSRVRPLAGAFGVTRLAVLTGLDVIGIPVAAAVRPASRTVAVHQGKGETLEAAKVSALMEALECFCAETAMLPAHFGTVEEMARVGAVVDPGRLPRCRGGPDPATTRAWWVEARDLATGDAVWVPRELVATDYCLPPAQAVRVFQATTNGLASGTNAEQALRHGLCEAIERDAMALWYAADQVPLPTLVDADTVDGPRSAALLARCREAGVDVTLWEATSDVGVPVFAARLSGPAGWPHAGQGAACRPDPDAALAAAILEAAQVRLTAISGARDDLPSETYDAPARDDAAAIWCGAAPQRRFDAAPRLPDTLDALLQRLAAAGFAQVLAVDLTHEALGLPVRRVIVPGLEGPWSEAEGEFCPGARLRAAARA